jgi:hypothetical protein
VNEPLGNGAQVACPELPFPRLVKYAEEPHSFEQGCTAPLPSIIKLSLALGTGTFRRGGRARAWAWAWARAKARAWALIAEQECICFSRPCPRLLESAAEAPHTLHHFFQPAVQDLQQARPRS